MKIRSKALKVLMSLSIVATLSPFYGGSASAAGDNQAELEKWLSNGFGINVEVASNPNKKIDDAVQGIQQDADIAPSKDTKYVVSRAFYGVGGWGNTDIHSRSKSNNKLIARQAWISRWEGIFTNEFAGITSTSGDATVIDLPNFNIVKQPEDSDQVSTGATMIPLTSMFTPAFMMILDPQGYRSGTEQARLEKRSQRIINNYTDAIPYDPDNKNGDQGVPGIMQVQNTDTGAAITPFFRVGDLVNALGGTMEKYNNFNSMPGFSTDANAYRGFTLYHMTPYPEFNTFGTVPFVKKWVNGKEVEGIVVDYSAYGYSNRSITARIGMKDGNEIDTMLPNSATVDGMLDKEHNTWIQPDTNNGMSITTGPSSRVNGEWVPGNNVKYDGSLFISMAQLMKYSKDGTFYLELNDGYERRTYINLGINIPQNPACPQPQIGGTGKFETPFFFYNPDPAATKENNSGMFYGQNIESVKGNFSQFNAKDFTANNLQNGIFHKSTLNINGKSATSDALNIGVVCKTYAHLGANGNSFNDPITRSFGGYVRDAANKDTYVSNVGTDTNVIRVNNAADLKAELATKYKELNVNPQFIVDSLNPQYQPGFYNSGGYEESIKYDKMQDKPLAQFTPYTGQKTVMEYQRHQELAKTNQPGTIDKSTFIKSDVVAELSGANVSVKEEKLPWIDDLVGKTDSSYYYRHYYNCGIGGCSHDDYFKKRFSFQPNESYYKNPALLKTEYTSAAKPAISRFYQNGNGDVVVQFTAEGYNSAAVSADLLLNFEGNKSKLPATLQNLDNPSTPSGGYWRKLVFNGFDATINKDYIAGGSAPFIFNLGSAKKDGAGKQQLGVTDLTTPAGITKDDANKRLIIPKAKVQEWFKLNDTMNLANEKYANGNTYEANKYTSDDKAGYRNIGNEAKPLTLYVADQYGRFDWLTMNYMPNGSQDGNKSPDFSYSQGNDYDIGPGQFTHTDPNGKGQNLEFGHNAAIHIDVTRPDYVSANGQNKPSLLAVWENDNESIRYAYDTTLNAVEAAKYLPFRFKTYNLGSLYNNGPGYTSPIQYDGTLSRTTGLKVDGWATNYKRFDPTNWLGTNTFGKAPAPNASTYYKDFPQSIRAGRGIFVESKITIRGILEGDSQAENVTSMKNFVNGIMDNYNLTGEKDAALLSSNKTYRNLNTNVSGEAHGGTSANFNGAYGSVKLEYKGSGNAGDSVGNGDYTSENVNAYEDASGKKQVVRTTFNFTVPVQLANATGKFGGQSGSKGNPVSGRQFFIHPNTQDGVYTIRTEGTADLSKLGLKGSMNFFSALDPIVVYGSIFDNYQESDQSVEIIPTKPTTGGSSGGGSGKPSTGTDTGTGETGIPLPDFGNLLD